MSWPFSASSALGWWATTATRSTSPRRPGRWCSRWLAGATFRQSAIAWRRSGLTTSSDSPPGRWSRRSRGRRASIPTPEIRPGAARESLRVAIDTRALADDGATGVGRYIRALLAALREVPRLMPLDYGNRLPRLIGPQLLTRLSMRAARAQVVHGPANTLPLVRVGIPGVVTIHDLAIYEHPEWFPRGQWFATRVLVPQSVRRAKLIVCPSQATMAAAARHFGIAPAHCRVIPHGVEPEFALPISAAVRHQVQARYALPQRYLLQVGTVQPRKNYLTSLRALSRLPASQRLPLVVVGGFGWGYDPVVEAVQTLGLTPWVRFVGYAGMGDLPALYQL